MNKNKILLATLLSFQVGTHLAGAQELPNQASAAFQNSQISELLNTLKAVQTEFVTVWVQFLNQDKLYPNMSVKELGDKVIYILNTSGEKLPANIRHNLIEIVKIKKQSTSTNEFLSGDVLFNDTMILLIDTILGHLHGETTNLLKLGVPIQDIATVKRALSAMRKAFDNLKRSGDYCGIKATIEKITALTEQLEPILRSQLKRNNIDLSSNDTPSMPSISGPMLLLLLSQRIALSNK